MRSYIPVSENKAYPIKTLVLALMPIENLTISLAYAHCSVIG